MAQKDTRIIVALRCEVCKNKNYTVYKSKSLQEKLGGNKYCSKCKKHTAHTETKLK